MTEIVANYLDKRGQAVSSLTNRRSVFVCDEPANSSITSWKENDTMFTILESSLAALERTKQNSSSSEFIEVSNMRYQKALSSYKAIFCTEVV